MARQKDWPKHVDLTHIAGGAWAAHTVYLVDVAFRAGNPIFRALFFTGFLNEDGTPGNYNQFYGVGEAGDVNRYLDCYYLKPLYAAVAAADLETKESVLPHERMPSDADKVIKTMSDVEAQLARLVTAGGASRGELPRLYTDLQSSHRKSARLLRRYEARLRRKARD